MLVCLLVGSEMYLRVEQEGVRRQAPSGRSLETWSEQRNVWMSWSSRARRSLNSSPNTKTIRDILYTQLPVHLHVPLVLFMIFTAVLFWPLTPHSTLGYVTYQDIRSIGSLQDQTVIAVKAPADTKLEVPDTEGVRWRILSASNVLG